MDTTSFDYLSSDIVYFAHRKCTKDWSIDDQIIDYHDLTYIYAGAATYYVDGVAHPVKAGDLLYIPSGKRRSAFTDPENLMKMYALNFNWISNEHIDAEFVLPFSTVTKVGHIQEIIGLYDSLAQIWSAREHCYRLSARSLCTLILSIFIKRIVFHDLELTSDARIKEVKSFLTKHYDKKMTMEEIAAHVNLNPVYLGALFKKSEGYSIKDYLNRIRINNVEGILMREHCTITEAALRCGFSDVYYFSRVYRNLKGVAPSRRASLQ